MWPSLPHDGGKSYFRHGREASGYGTHLQGEEHGIAEVHARRALEKADPPCDQAAGSELGGQTHDETGQTVHGRVDLVGGDVSRAEVETLEVVAQGAPVPPGLVEGEQALSALGREIEEDGVTVRESVEEEDQLDPSAPILVGATEDEGKKGMGATGLRKPRRYEARRPDAAAKSSPRFESAIFQCSARISAEARTMFFSPTGVPRSPRRATARDMRSLLRSPRPRARVRAGSTSGALRKATGMA